MLEALQSTSLPCCFILNIVFSLSNLQLIVSRLAKSSKNSTSLPTDTSPQGFSPCPIVSSLVQVKACTTRLPCLLRPEYFTQLTICHPAFTSTSLFPILPWAPTSMGPPTSIIGDGATT